jgi:CRISPR-associated protein Csb2
MGAGPDFLVLEASFIAGTYGGAEWPPAPFRLLQAIVAGCRSIDIPGLGWLEHQAPPFILATNEPPAVRFRRSIPNNADTRKPHSALSLRDIVHRRIEDPVRYCYPLRTAADHDAAQSVIAAATQVHTLGTGEDMCTVRGLVATHAPESDATIRLWLPTTGGGAGVSVDSEVWLRVAVPGSLQSLEDRFQAFQRRLNSGDDGYARPVSAPALHRTVAYRTSDDMPRTALLALRLVQLGDQETFRRFHAEDAVVVGGMLRHAVMRLADVNLPALADFAAGYGTEIDPNHRMSWVPVPSIGHAHADGLIRRAVLLARAADAQALGDLTAWMPADGVALVDEASGECVAMAVPVDPADEPVLRHYLAPTKDWVSVTPVVLPGEYGGGDIRVMTKLLHKAVRESGIDPGLIEGAEFSKSAFIKQGARLRDVKLKDWTAKNLILYHVRLRFRSAVRGPLVLGRGRHFGLGLFCANPQ